MSRPLPEKPLEAFRERLVKAMLKSVREARLRTNWTVPRTDYEARVTAVVETALSLKPGASCLPSRLSSAKLGP